MSVLAAQGSSMWYMTRAAGIVLLILLTASVVLGIVTSQRWAAPRWPRFVLQQLHRNVSLLVMVLLAFHVATTVIDGYVKIGWKDVFVPFTAGWNPFWVGLGAVACDMLVALVITSLVRRRLGYGTWKAIHWMAYAAWPVAVIHGLGTGTDATAWWMLVIVGVCISSVIAAGWWRLSVPPAEPVMAAEAAPQALSSASDFSGSVRVSPVDSRGLVTVMFDAMPASGRLRIVLRGHPRHGGGVDVTDGRVTYGPPGEPERYKGRVTSMQGGRVLASLTDSVGQDLQAVIDLTTDYRTGTVSGRIHFRTLVAA